ncbi:excinuclease ABC subunit UvrB, partial [Candidatus Azambacteria bacterium]|nr:excinuclease ABC subunit UvrB [Candidatus Azambacteria bacterium]
QPEAYLPRTDTYIDKDVKINETLDQLRHEAAQSILSRGDVVVVASVSCIYNIGSPASYERLSLYVSAGQSMKQREFLKHLVSLQYQRNDIEKLPGTFQAKGESVFVCPPTGNDTIKIVFEKAAIAEMFTADDYLSPSWEKTERVRIFPAKFWISEQKTTPIAVANIKNELTQRLKELETQGKLVEAQRLKQRTEFDLEMLQSTGYCRGIENYSSHMEFREPGSPPSTLIDYFIRAYGADFLVVVDESHMTIPQIKGMYHGDRARKDTLIDYGFRLPSARDNRPLKMHEFEGMMPQALYLSATPSEYELKKSEHHVTEQIARPTGLLDPEIFVRPTHNQTTDAIEEIKVRVKKHQRVLITVLTKRMAEDFADFLKEQGVKAEYMHSEVKTLQRADTLERLRAGEHDVIVGVNLLREGLDLPEVSLVIIMDADKEGFLRNKTTLIQTMGRAARHHEGRVIMYADTVTQSMKGAMDETNRRRNIQERYNTAHGITPRQIEKPIRERIAAQKSQENVRETEFLSPGLLTETKNVKKLIADYTKEMKQAARELDFTEAERLKRLIQKLKRFA